MYLGLPVIFKLLTAVCAGRNIQFLYIIFTEMLPFLFYKYFGIQMWFVFVVFFCLFVSMRINLERFLMTFQ